MEESASDDKAVGVAEVEFHVPVLGLDESDPWFEYEEVALPELQSVDADVLSLTGGT